MTTCLKDVFIEVPLAIKEGTTAVMRCDYDLEEEALYTVKWYKGRQEFFRYVPKELPHTRVFPIATINVDVSESGPNQVVLRQVTPELDGKYRCEVSADAPTFHTQIVAAWMHVVRTMDGKPELQLEKPQYSPGEKLRANCSSPPSNPPANITWFINDKELGNGRTFRIPSVRPSGSLYKTVSSIEYDVLIAGKLKVKCQSDIYHVIGSETVVMLDEDKPRLASILQPQSHSTGLKSAHPVGTILLITFVVIR
ncbi:Immunoglobulin subtype,Immunoglobulin-like domain,Immunoglobulin-like fold,CD80-like, immunoglobulin [Cinara cedri]|uniref:Immunoglobulin subtype,Immunoglobulin-like domain,Immunoglobulin-like fold,CD80-like, immunoglobulin n=1 Tax=Cinara cedri TaxID=506608 RepID=A0A5E4MUB7_9HEMI|nr:Immunoglobulin subtype,Immunoglobulin-like domain,Immunoglobulin-like fold,CD80-like, immunoglobulin [Cinara cedri]